MKYIMYRISINNYNYIGHTTNFTQRKNSHKSRCINDNNKYHNFILYKTIREQGGWDCCEMVPIEEYECDTIIQARIREEQLRIQYNAEMNARKAYADKNEYVREHKEENKTRCKNWYIDNRDKAVQYKSEKVVCQCGAIIARGGISKHIKTDKHLECINALA